MQFLEEEILEIIEATWTSMLDLEIHPSQASSKLEGSLSILVGQVDISGAWEGRVLLHGTSALAQSAASKIFAIAIDEVQEQDQIDAMYELTNIIAGNIKSLLPEPCQLSLPKVEPASEWDTQAIGADRVSELSFECGGQPLLVTVWKRELSNA